MTIPIPSQYDKEKFRELAADADLQDVITPAMIISLADAAKNMRESDGGNTPRRTYSTQTRN